ncbi:YqaJ viral recombinase family protein, partial [Escherichia coli]|nr:YqaJ viral recombinase family protein [Escherichia coli]
MSQALKPFGLQKVDKNVTENRNIYVGGSDVPTILGINKYNSQFELAKEKTGIQPSQFTGNEYTAFGNALEPQIR